MNFLLTRSRYKGKLNYLAYIGMLGDIAALTLAYVLLKERSRRKQAAIEANKENERIEKL